MNKKHMNIKAEIKKFNELTEKELESKIISFGFETEKGLIFISRFSKIHYCIIYDTVKKEFIAVKSPKEKIVLEDILKYN